MGLIVSDICFARDTANSLLEPIGINSTAIPILIHYLHYLELGLTKSLAAAGAFDIDTKDKNFGHNLIHCGPKLGV